MSILSWVVARYYDKMLDDAEKKCLRDWRATLLSQLSGSVFEIGSGTGLNLAHYPKQIERLVLTEPDMNMRKRLSEAASKQANCPYELLALGAETIPLPDNSFDAVVSTLVLCSVIDQKKALSELYRILRPNGKMVFIEHVAAKNNKKRMRWQKRIEPFWKRLICGCHLTRNTEEAIAHAGFQIQQIKRQSMRGVPPIVRPSIRGIAIKPSLNIYPQNR